MNGFAQVLLNEYKDKLDADGQDFLHEIHSNTVRMGALIDALLSLSRVTRNEVRPEPIDRAAIARRVAADLAAGEPERSVEVVIQDDLGAHLDPQLATSTREGAVITVEGATLPFSKSVGADQLAEASSWESERRG